MSLIQDILVGSIVLVQFPFTNLQTEKKRPVLVLHCFSLKENLQIFTCSMITSKMEAITMEGDTLLKDWEQSGLLNPSLLRLSKMATLESNLICRELGKISKRDHREVQKNFSKIFKDWI